MVNINAKRAHFFRSICMQLNLKRLKKYAEFLCSLTTLSETRKVYILSAILQGYSLSVCGKIVTFFDEIWKRTSHAKDNNNSTLFFILLTLKNLSFNAEFLCSFPLFFLSKRVHFFRNICMQLSLKELKTVAEKLLSFVSVFSPL